MTEKKVITCYLDEKTQKELKDQAEKEGRSVSNLIAQIIKKYLAEQQKD